MDKWREMVREQGGDPDAPLPVADHQKDVVAEASGVLTDMDALKLGVASWRLGAGRARKEDPVQAGAGIELFARPGDRVEKGQKLLTLHTETPERFERAEESLEGTLTIDPNAQPSTPGSVVLERIG